MRLTDNSDEQLLLKDLFLLGLSIIGYVLCAKVLLALIAYFFGADEFKSGNIYVFLCGLVFIWLHRKYGRKAPNNNTKTSNSQ
ncbi:MAG: hypothetical protein HZA22_07640 [Nitrospirae bacterium]|nr:hypothetical protein [Nitrospirota bacterium]